MNHLISGLVGLQNWSQCTRRTPFSNNAFRRPKTMPFKVFLVNKSKPRSNTVFRAPEGSDRALFGLMDLNALFKLFHGIFRPNLVTYNKLRHYSSHINQMVTHKDLLGPYWRPAGAQNGLIS